MLGHIEVVIATFKPPSLQAPGHADNLAQRVSYAWAGLSRACHQHPYELSPTSVELLAWLRTVEHLIDRVSTA